MTEMSWEVDEEVNQDKNGEADGMNLEVDSKDEVTSNVDLKWYVAYWIVPPPMTLIDLQGRSNYFCLKISVAYISGFWLKSRRSS